MQSFTWLSDHVGWGIAGLLFLDRFLNNLLVRVPSLRSNTWFECIANTVDALVSTIKGKDTTQDTQRGN
jgi:hypothetical protein